MGDGVNIAARLEGHRRARRDLSVRGRLPPGERQARYGGHRSRPDAAQEHRKIDPGLFAASRRPRPSETCDRGEARRAEKAFVARAARAGIAALVILIAAGAWYFLAANRAVTTTRPPVASNAAPAEAAHLSIVVLPFTNLSGDPSQDYFADGITENLTTDLSRIRNSFVIARNTAFTFKGKSRRRQGDRQGARRSLCARRLGAARPEPRARQCAAHRRANPARICGPTASRKTSPTCSSCRIRSSRDWPAVWVRTCQGRSGKGRPFQKSGRHRSHHARLGLDVASSATPERKAREAQ